MPHLVVELSDKLYFEDEHALLVQLNAVMFASGLFACQDIKSRIHHADSSLIGLGGEDEHFVSVQIWLMSGRSDEVKSALTSAVLKALVDFVSPLYRHVQYAVDIHDLSTHYQKFRL